MVQQAVPASKGLNDRASRTTIKAAFLIAVGASAAILDIGISAEHLCSQEKPAKIVVLSEVIRNDHDSY